MLKLYKIEGVCRAVTKIFRVAGYLQLEQGPVIDCLKAD